LAFGLSSLDLWNLDLDFRFQISNFKFQISDW